MCIESTSFLPTLQTKILRLVEELRVTIDALDNDEEIRGQVPESTLSQVSRWMSGGINDDLESSPNPLNATAFKGRSSATGNLIRKLENDKESLSLQVRIIKSAQTSGKHRLCLT